MACELGADAIGMIFHPQSRRNITIARARKIIEQLTAFVMPVGVFVDADPSVILSTAEQLQLNHVQLNGGESPELVDALKPLKVIKAIKVDAEHFEGTLTTWRKAIQTLDLHNLAALVLEPAHSGLPGGSGMANNWAIVTAAQQAGQFDGLPPLIAAGGLTPETVASVIRTIHPYAVDVSSGVESSTGIKSEEKLRHFIHAARSAIA